LILIEVIVYYISVIFLTQCIFGEVQNDGEVQPFLFTVISPCQFRVEFKLCT